MKNKSKECNLICNYSLTEKEDYIRKYVNSKLKENYENETPFSYIKRDMPNMIKLIFLTFICGTVLFYFITIGSLQESLTYSIIGSLLILTFLEGRNIFWFKRVKQKRLQLCETISNTSINNIKEVLIKEYVEKYNKLFRPKISLENDYDLLDTYSVYFKSEIDKGLTIYHGLKPTIIEGASLCELLNIIVTLNKFEFLEDMSINGRILSYEEKSGKIVFTKDNKVYKYYSICFHNDIKDNFDTSFSSGDIIEQNYIQYVTTETIYKGEEQYILTLTNENDLFYKIIHYVPYIKD